MFGVNCKCKDGNKNGPGVLLFFLCCLFCWLNSRVVMCQQATVEERGRERQKEEEIVSWMDAAILIKPLDGVTAGHPQPSAACFLSKQDCLTWSLSHTHTHTHTHTLTLIGTQTKTVQSPNTLTHIHRSVCTSFFPTQRLMHEYLSHSLSHTYMHTHTHRHGEPSRPHKSLIFQLCRQAAVGSLSPWQGSPTRGRELSVSPLTAWMTGAQAAR